MSGWTNRGRARAWEAEARAAVSETMDGLARFERLAAGAPGPDFEELAGGYVSPEVSLRIRYARPLLDVATFGQVSGDSGLVRAVEVLVGSEELRKRLGIDGHCLRLSPMPVDLCAAFGGLGPFGVSVRRKRQGCRWRLFGWRPRVIRAEVAEGWRVAIMRQVEGLRGWNAGRPL